MTQSRFQIIVNIRVADGYVETGRFFIGPDRDAAFEMFKQLKGVPMLAGKAMLRLDLAEEEEELSTVLQTQGCTLSEMTENVKIIMKETFRLINLE